jgi:predicted 2-oxoglutarate/Fe(II)-dependent dioxygenase YbiX
MAFVESCLDARRDEIAAFFRIRLRRREGAGLLRYEPGGFYGRHVDRAEMPSWPDAARRAITIVLFLNSSREAEATGDFTGGRLRVFPSGASGDSVDIVPTEGTLVAFPSCTPHEVTPVIDGCRDAVVDWFYS